MWNVINMEYKTTPKRKREPYYPPPADELAKIQFLEDMTYNHDGWTCRMKRWHYEVVYDFLGGADLVDTGNFSWYEEDLALAEVDRHRAMGHTAYVTRLPPYTDSEIYAEKRRVRTKYDSKDDMHRTRKKEPWYELPNDLNSISPYDHSHRFDRQGTADARK